MTIIIIGIALKEIYEEKIILKEITKYDENTGNPYKIKKQFVERYYKGREIEGVEVKNNLALRDWSFLKPLRIFLPDSHQSLQLDVENSIIGLEFCHTENTLKIKLGEILEKIKEVKVILGLEPSVFLQEVK